jgi:molybdopterin-containing oxidoreductase family membrane subunit
MFTASLLVNVGMWFERFVIVVTSLANDFLPSSWGMYEPTWVDVATFLGSFGLFMTFFLLFIRYLPVLAIAEIKGIMPQADPHGHGHSYYEMEGETVASAKAAEDDE